MRLALSCLLLAVATPAAAQDIDRGAYEIHRGDATLGREEFSIQAGSGGSPAGSTIASLAKYPGSRPVVQIQAVLERDADGAVTTLQLDTRQRGQTSRIYGAAVQGNLTIRQTTTAAESVREFPRSTGIVILDDSVFAFYRAVADRATTTGARLPVLFPRSGRRGQLTATRASPTTVEMTGAVSGTLTVDATGRLVRIILSDGVSAIRQGR